jgi:hypothetical protein
MSMNHIDGAKSALKKRPLRDLQCKEASPDSACCLNLHLELVAPLTSPGPDRVCHQSGPERVCLENLNALKHVQTSLNLLGNSPIVRSLFVISLAQSMSSSFFERLVMQGGKS